MSANLERWDELLPSLPLDSIPSLVLLLILMVRISKRPFGDL